LTLDTSCFSNVPCGDVNRSGVVTSTDALLALQLEACASCEYDGLADVTDNNGDATHTPDGQVTSDDADLILQVAVGSATVSTCGNYPAPAAGACTSNADCPPNIPVCRGGDGCG